MSRLAFDICLYGIVDPEHCAGRGPAELAGIAAENGITLLQYRDKISDTRKMVETVHDIKTVLEGTSVKLLINDRVDVALASNADGVHLGQSDMDCRDARALFDQMMPSAIIGASIKTEADIERTPLEAIDYAFIGGVHATTSKDNPTAIGVKGWEKLAAILREKEPALPIGAVAGFNLDNVAEIFLSGADGVAMISALFEADNVAERVKAMREKIDDTISQRSQEP